MDKQRDYKPQPVEAELTEAALEAEAKIFSLSGLNPDTEMKFYDVKFDYFGENYIHTIRIGDKNQLNMVMLHGYGGTGVTFYRMVGQLSLLYKIYVVDFLGIGLSSRPVFTMNSTEECIEFFVESLEKWRQAAGLERFHLLGHSLGGYLGICYALKYPQYISKISLVSPAGITKYLRQETFDEMTRDMGYFRKYFFCVVLNLWERKFTPHELFKSSGFIGKEVMKGYFRNRYGRPKDESEALYQYFLNVFDMPESGEKSLCYFFKPPKAIAKDPLEDKCDALKMRVDFYFGEKDWMDWSGSYKVVSRNEERFRLIWVKEAGHNINIDNPDLLCEYILKYSDELTEELKDKDSQVLRNEMLEKFGSTPTPTDGN